MIQKKQPRQKLQEKQPLRYTYMHIYVYVYVYVYMYIYCMFFAGTACFIVMDHRSVDSFPAYHGRCSTASKVEIHLQKNDIKLPNTQPVKIRND